MKMILFFCFIVAGSVVHGQSFSIQMQRPSLNNIASIEKKAGGEEYKMSSTIRFTISKNYFPGADKYNLDNPLVWDRQERLRMFVQYFYSLPDSIVRLTEYTLNNADTVLLKNTFNNNAEQIQKMLGKSLSDTTENHEDWRQRTIDWENNGTHVRQFIVLGSGTYRVRVLVSWK